jgi:hypothetical protein
VSVVQLKKRQKLKSKVCINSSRVEVENASNSHHEEFNSSRDGMVVQKLLESTNSQQIEDIRTVSVALLTVMSESQVENGVVEQCSRSADSKCIASSANCTFFESDAKPKK